MRPCGLVPRGVQLRTDLFSGSFARGVMAVACRWSAADVAIAVHKPRRAHLPSGRLPPILPPSPRVVNILGPSKCLCVCVDVCALVIGTSSAQRPASQSPPSTSLIKQTCPMHCQSCSHHAVILLVMGPRSRSSMLGFGLSVRIWRVLFYPRQGGR